MTLKNITLATLRIQVYLIPPSSCFVLLKTVIHVYGRCIRVDQRRYHFYVLSESVLRVSTVSTEYKVIALL